MNKEELIKISNITDSLKYINDYEGDNLTKFFEGNTITDIGTYINRIARYLYKWMIYDVTEGPHNEKFTKTANPSDYFIVALDYIKRSKIPISKSNIHRLFLTSVMVTLKVLEDESPDNLWFSSVGGIPLKKLNKLEHIFIYKIDWELQIARKQKI